jgi:hypothetical protein
MNFHRIAAACALAFAASVVSAQSADAPAAASAAKQDCAKRHDHGAERQAPTPQAGCKTTQKVAKAKSQAKSKGAIQGHDHGKMHKNQ